MKLFQEINNIAGGAVPTRSSRSASYAAARRFHALYAPVPCKTGVDPPLPVEVLQGSSATALAGAEN
ncbi:MAG: hypothetical protein LBH70_09215 [Spirochaetaceae bacterium]|nr:hypothetical protein [Spirochaetaceae bacterium]